MEFCNLAFEEPCNYEIYNWEEESELSGFRIGQIYMMTFQDENVLDDYDDQDAEEAFMILVENERCNVAHSLSANIGKGGDSTVFVSMFVTCIDFYDYDDDEDNDEESISDDTITYDIYEREIDEHYADIVNEDITNKKMAAFGWLDQGTFRLKI